MKKRIFTCILSLLTVLLMGLVIIGGAQVSAEEPNPRGEVYIKGIDYETLVMKVYKNGNDIVFCSTDGKTWNELEGIPGKDTLGKTGEPEDFLWVDISWTSASSETKLYLRGDSGEGLHEKVVKFPKSSNTFKVTFNKITGGFNFNGVEKQEYFYYRKFTDSNGWQKVYFEGFEGLDGISYEDFLSIVESLRFKGAKLVCKLGQYVDADTNESDPGERPSKEVTVTVTKLASAPSVKLNLSRLTLNTKVNMEYCTDVEDIDNDSEWIPCTATMKLEDITTDYETGKSSNLFFRVKATDTKPASQIALLVIPGQLEAPINNKNFAVQYLPATDKMALSFLNASKTPYEYCVEKASNTDFNLETAKWTSVMKDKTVSLSRSQYDGATIYIRYKGVNANVNKGIELRLPSEPTYTTLIFPAKPDTK